MEVEGTTHGDGVYAANTAVRQTHGSSILTNRAAVMRSNPWVMSMLPFYNFFSNALQRTYELGWQSKLATQGRELPEMTGFEKETFEKGMKHVPNILGGVMTYGVLVSLIEQAVDPLEYKEDDDPIKWGAKVISRGPLSMIPGMRNLLGIYEGYEPTVGLAQSFLKDITAPATGKEWVADPGKALRTVNLALGAATGLSFDAAGKAAQFTYNVLADNEHPEDVFDYLKGIRHGTMKEKHPRPVLGPLGEQ